MADAPEPFSGDSAVAPVGLPGLGGLVTLLTCVVVVAALSLAREVLIPITLAVLLSFLLAPLVNLLRELRLGRVPSVLIAAILGIALILGIGGLIGVQIAELAASVPQYTYTVEHKIESVESFTLGHFAGALHRLKEVAPPQPAKPPPAAQPGAKAAPKPLAVEMQPAPLSPMTLAENVLTPILSRLATAGIVFVVTIFVLLQREDLRDRFIRLIGSGDLHRTTVAMDDAGHRLSRYFLAQLSVNAAFGCIIGLGLALIGVPSPILWGVMGMLLRFVPYIGSPIAAVLPIALAAAVDPGWTMAISTAALFLVIELITGQIVEPLLYGHSTGLSPVAVIVSAIFWTWIWGPIGLILSMPLTLCMVVMGRYVKRLEFLDILLGDRPALTPVESFYQRMLAADPDEALEQAEAFLRENTLSEYYDEVALPGLQLASSDALRGVLNPEQVHRLSETVEALVRDLHEQPDAAPPIEPPGPSLHLPHLRAADPGPPEAQLQLPSAWQGEVPVLCVAGRGPLDEVASQILAQLLIKHGLNAKVVPHSAASRVNVGSLPVSGVAMVCIPYLDIIGAPAHLRNLVRRLRQRLPDQPILVGLWPRTDSLLSDERLRTTVGADFYVSSFHDAVAACLETARHAGEPRRQTAA